MRLRIAKSLISPRPIIFVTVIIISAIIWFLPEALRIQNPQEAYPFLILDKFTLSNLPPIIAHIIQFVINIGVWVYVMRMSEKMRIIPVRSAMPFIIGMLLTSSLGYLQYFNHNTVAFILLIFSLQQLLSIYHSETSSVSAFNIAVLLLIATLFQPYYSCMAILFLLGSIIFRIFEIRTLFAALTGVVAPVFILISILFLTDNMLMLRGLFDNLSFYDFSYIDVPRSDILFACSILVISVLALLSYIPSSLNFKLSVRLNFSFISWSFLLSIVLMVIFFNHYHELLFVPLLFIVFIQSLYFSTNSGRVSSIMLITLSILCIAYRIVWLLNF